MNTSTDERFRQYDFTIAYDEHLDERYKILPEVKQLLQESFYDVMERRVGAIERLKTYVHYCPVINQTFSTD